MRADPYHHVTPEYVRDRLDYDPETGVLRWKTKPCRGMHIGDVAGSENKEGYIRLNLHHKRYCAHRVAWMHFHSEWPSGQIDHIDGNRSNNSIANLRVVSNSGNQKNRSLCSRNKSGCIGVSWESRRGYWKASIASDGERKCLGTGTLLDMAAVRKSEEIRLGFHIHHGRERNDRYIHS